MNLHEVIIQVNKMGLIVRKFEGNREVTFELSISEIKWDKDTIENQVLLSFNDSSLDSLSSSQSPPSVNEKNFKGSLLSLSSHSTFLSSSSTFFSSHSHTSHTFIENFFFSLKFDGTTNKNAFVMKLLLGRDELEKVVRSRVSERKKILSRALPAREEIELVEENSEEYGGIGSAYITLRHNLEKRDKKKTSSLEVSNTSSSTSSPLTFNPPPSSNIPPPLPLPSPSQHSTKGRDKEEEGNFGGDNANTKGNNAKDNYAKDNYGADHYGEDPDSDEEQEESNKVSNSYQEAKENYGEENYGEDNYGEDNYGEDNYGEDLDSDGEQVSTEEEKKDVRKKILGIKKTGKEGKGMEKGKKGVESGSSYRFDPSSSSCDSLEGKKNKMKESEGEEREEERGGVGGGGENYGADPNSKEDEQKEEKEEKKGEEKEEEGENYGAEESSEEKSKYAVDTNTEEEDNERSEKSGKSEKSEKSEKRLVIESTDSKVEEEESSGGRVGIEEEESSEFDWNAEFQQHITSLRDPYLKPKLRRKHTDALIKLAEDFVSCAKRYGFSLSLFPFFPLTLSFLFEKVK